jgi:hypothetical protein
VGEPGAFRHRALRGVQRDTVWDLRSRSAGCKDCKWLYRRCTRMNTDTSL